MIETCYEQLCKKENLRENLSILRNEIKNPQKKEALQMLCAGGEQIIAFLKEEDPKVRKNAALLLGDLGAKQSVEPLFFAYEQEQTLFVKSAYLTALGKMDVADYLPRFQSRLSELLACEAAVDEKKHIQDEIRELEKLITGIEGIKKHEWTGLLREHEILLTTWKQLRNVTLDEVTEDAGIASNKRKLHPLGVTVVTDKLECLLSLRTFRELLFPLCKAQKVKKEPKAAAMAVWNSDLLRLLEECHKPDGAFYFRLELRSRMELDKKTNFAKKFAAELEQLSNRRFINSTRDYEIEIRLVETREETFAVFAKLLTIPMKRFSYRKHAIAASIHPSLAAMLVKIAQPYLKEDAQILDPFCGVGTMLIERDKKVPAREKYGIDIYGEAIRMARENASAAGEKINFINRNYFDFSHEYLFDEIITNMPVRGRKTKEEMDEFYASFFEKSKELLTPGGVIILYTNEEGFVKKQLRLNVEYRLLQEKCIREKDDFYLYVIGYKIR